MRETLTGYKDYIPKKGWKPAHGRATESCDVTEPYFTLRTVGAIGDLYRKHVS